MSDYCLRIYREHARGKLECLYSGVLGEGVPEDILRIYRTFAPRPLMGSIEPKDTEPAKSIQELIERCPKEVIT